MKTLFDDLSVSQKIEALAALERENEQIEKMQPIYKKLEGDVIEDIWIMGDEFQFVQVFDAGFNRTLYAGFINYKSTNRYEYTLIECILDTIAVKYDGINTRAGQLMARMLKVDSKTD